MKCVFKYRRGGISRASVGFIKKICILSYTDKSYYCIILPHQRTSISVNINRSNVSSSLCTLIKKQYKNYKTTRLVTQICKRDSYLYKAGKYTYISFCFLSASMCKFFDVRRSDPLPRSFTYNEVPLVFPRNAVMKKSL